MQPAELALIFTALKRLLAKKTRRAFLSWLILANFLWRLFLHAGRGHNLRITFDVIIKQDARDDHSDQRNAQKDRVGIIGRLDFYSHGFSLFLWSGRHPHASVGMPRQPI